MSGTCDTACPPFPTFSIHLSDCRSTAVSTCRPWHSHLNLLSNLLLEKYLTQDRYLACLYSGCNYKVIYTVLLNDVLLLLKCSTCCNLALSIIASTWSLWETDKLCFMKNEFNCSCHSAPLSTPAVPALNVSPSPVQVRQAGCHPDPTQIWVQLSFGDHYKFSGGSLPQRCR